MDCSLPGSSVHGIFQAIVLEWIAISFSRGSPGDRTQLSDFTHLWNWLSQVSGSNPGLPHCRQMLYRLSHQGSFGKFEDMPKSSHCSFDIRNKVKFCSGPGLICAVIHAGGDLIEVPWSWIQNFPVTSKFRIDDIHSSQTSRLLGP